MVRLGFGLAIVVASSWLLTACDDGGSGEDFTPGDGDGGGAGGGDGDGGGAGGGDGDGGGGGGAGRVFMPGTDPARNQVQAGRLCRRLAEIQCAGEAFCCDAPGRTQAQCETVMEQGCNGNLYLDDVAGSAVGGFDAGRAAVAFQAFEDKAATCDPTIAKWASEDAGLRGIMRGTSGSACNPQLAADTESQRRKAAIALASCSLDQNLACQPSVAITSWVCEARGTAGASCFSDFNCSPEAYCDNPNMQIAGGRCQTRKPVGQPCGYFYECATLLCGAGGTCVDGDVQAAYCLAK